MVDGWRPRTCPTILQSSSRTIWQGKITSQNFQQPHQNHLTSINSEIDHCDDGNVLITRELLNNTLRAKICWGILTPCRRGVPFWCAYPCDVSKFSVHFGPHCWDAVIHLQHTIVLVYAQYELWPWLTTCQSKLWPWISSIKTIGYLLPSWLLHCLSPSSRCAILLSSLCVSLLSHSLSLSSCCVLLSSSRRADWLFCRL